MTEPRDYCAELHGPECQESCLWETGAPGRDRRAYERMEGDEMDRYEYRFVEVNFLDGTGDKELTALGRDGWKVLDTRQHPNNEYMSVVLMERPVSREVRG